MVEDTEKKLSPDEVTFELLKMKIEEGANLVTHYLRAYAFFLAITGVLLKFALDQSATAELRKVMCIFGIMLCLIGFLVCYFGESLRKKIVEDISNLSSRLQAPILASNLATIRYIVIAAVWFTLSVLIVWIFLLT
jgi:hypothetical protein